VKGTLGWSLLSRRPVATGGANSPPLTSLVDMMTILVVFLLVNFSVQGELAGSATALRLPDSTSRQPLQPGLAVEVGPQVISVDGRPVIGLAAALAGDSLLIAPLASALRAAQAGRPPARVTLECDRDLDFALLKRVIHTCSHSGLADFALLVRTLPEGP
jgi:biopolymer transport protein TolR